MLIGQAPGANEDKELRPFIGRSGKLLDSVLRRARINRKNTYITSVVQFFPPKNRIPTPEEIRICKPFLLRQIEIVRPRYVVLLGNVSSNAVLGRGEIEKNHGKLSSNGGIEYMATFHPAAALRFKDNYPLMVEDFKRFSQAMK
jgi:DNA polymerase